MISDLFSPLRHTSLGYLEIEIWDFTQKMFLKDFSLSNIYHLKWSGKKIKPHPPPSRSQCLQGEFFPLYFPLASFAYVNMPNSVVQIRELNQGQGDEVAPSFFLTSIFYKNQHNLRNKAFFSLRSEIRSKKGFFR